MNVELFSETGVSEETEAKIKAQQSAGALALDKNNETPAQADGCCGKCGCRSNG